MHITSLAHVWIIWVCVYTLLVLLLVLVSAAGVAVIGGVVEFNACTTAVVNSTVGPGTVTCAVLCFSMSAGLGCRDRPGLPLEQLRHCEPAVACPWRNLQVCWPTSAETAATKSSMLSL